MSFTVARLPYNWKYRLPAGNFVHHTGLCLRGLSETMSPSRVFTSLVRLAATIRPETKVAIGLAVCIALSLALNHLVNSIGQPHDAAMAEALRTDG